MSYSIGKLLLTQALDKNVTVKSTTDLLQINCTVICFTIYILGISGSLIFSMGREKI